MVLHRFDLVDEMRVQKGEVWTLQLWNHITLSVRATTLRKILSDGFRKFGREIGRATSQKI